MNPPFPHVYPVDPSPEALPMRSFNDEHGGHWQAALLEASFGNVMLVFSRIGAGGVLRTPLDTANFHQAEQWLASADEDTLRDRLATAESWA